MDNLAVLIEREDSTAVERVAVFARMLVNDKEMDCVLSIDEFFRSVSSGGLRPLFVCECGDFGCGGYYVEVEPTADCWIMRNRYDALDKQMVSEFEHRVSWPQVAAAGRKILDALAAIREARPKVQVCCGQHGDEVVERIGEYQGVVERLERNAD